jgi:hypothetical protein
LPTWRRNPTAEPADDNPLARCNLQGFKYLDKLLPRFDRLHDVGCQRDRAGNRTLHFDRFPGTTVSGFPGTPYALFTTGHDLGGVIPWLD